MLKIARQGLAFNVRLLDAVGCATIETDDWPMGADAEIATDSDKVKP